MPIERHKPDMSPRLFRDLVKATDPGDYEKSGHMFALLGGEYERQPVNNQSGEFGPWLPKWPKGMETGFGVHFTTNLHDLTATLSKRRIGWFVATSFDGLGTAYAFAECWKDNKSGHCLEASTPCVALCLAYADLVEKLG